ncbi:MAG: hypothetical protein RMK73_03255 [Geminicoccaceae bacterium]|nr:hypothetical protein [Geminicoccaceae bacterium]MDW8340483.1 hypothetical protein [Geminicoccaceae bacterium]
MPRNLSLDTPFVPSAGHRAPSAGGLAARGRPLARRALALREFPLGPAAEERPTVDTNGAPLPASETAPLSFTEDELARVCAALSVRLRREFERETENRLRSLARGLEARLTEALARSARERARDRTRAAAAIARAVGVALEALVPRLRSERLSAALETLLAETLASRPAGPLSIEAPAEDLPELQARLPGLLAAAGADLTYEIRPLPDPGAILRIRWEESWAEIDLEAWTRAVIERVRDFLDQRTSLGPTDARMGGDHVRE